MIQQASLRQRCPDLETIPDGTGRSLLPWALSTIKAYRICQNRHEQLVEALPALTPPK